MLSQPGAGVAQRRRADDGFRVAVVDDVGGLVRSQPCGASEILLSGLPSVWQYVCADSRVAEISILLGSAPLLSFSILLISSFCFFSSWLVKSLHLVSPPVLITCDAEHPLN